MSGMEKDKLLTAVARPEATPAAKSGNRDFLEAALINAEVGLDSLIDNEAIAALPVVATAVKICRGIDDVRSRLFIAKLAAFFNDQHLRSQDANRKMKEKIEKSPDEARKVGEALILVLDRFIDMDKPAILSKIFIAYLDDIVSAEDLQRLAQCIDIAFSADLYGLLNAEDVQQTTKGPEYGFRPWMTSLINSGLTTNKVTGPPVGGSKMYYEVTQLGQKLWQAWRHVGTAR